MLLVPAHRGVQVIVDLHANIGLRGRIISVLLSSIYRLAGAPAPVEHGLEHLLTLVSLFEAGVLHHAWQFGVARVSNVRLQTFLRVDAELLTSQRAQRQVPVILCT